MDSYVGNAKVKCRKPFFIEHDRDVKLMIPNHSIVATPLAKDS